jgi:NAD(P) transhydrogenase subunit alpha
VIFDPVDMVFIFALAVFLGFEVISKVPSILHTPLMSAQGALQTALALLAVFLATLNIVGGVVVTDRMLDMFKGRQQVRAGPPAKGEAGSGAASSTASSSSASSEGGNQRPQP